MRAKPFCHLMCSLFLPAEAIARTWLDIQTYHNPSPIDASIVTFIIENDPLHFTPSPSQFPSESPSVAPSSIPTATARPTGEPSIGPSGVPSSSPSMLPTEIPSLSPSGAPSLIPSISPTQELYPPNDPPEEYNITYFNYDDSISSIYGPGFPQLVLHNATAFKTEFQNNAWANRQVPEDWYWKEFDSEENGGYGAWAGVLAKRMGRNDCGNVGKQSPIDLVPNGALCFEHHQIRSRRGDLSISNASQVEKIIEGNKLRLKYKRRACLDYDLPHCAEPDPPNADFPNNWGGYIDALNVDFKVPSEHTIMGERFDGEMQIYYLHPSRRRTPTVSVMMNATALGWNSMLQIALDRFQFVYDDHRAQCASKIRHERKLVSRIHNLLGGGAESKYFDYDMWGEYSTLREDPKYNERSLQWGIWDPHHPSLVPSLYFFGYEGSITEPPCNEWVTWFIIDTPMTMNLIQLEQMKRLIFTHVTPDCTPSSVHYRSSVARPIQDSFNRPVWRCTAADFPPDSERTDADQPP